MRIADNGTVGIGANSPGGKLEIASNPDAGAQLVLNQTLPGWGTVQLHDNFRYIRTQFAGDPADGPFRAFNVGASGVAIGYDNVPAYGSQHALYVNGNVGIGTTSPTLAKLVVNGGIQRNPYPSPIGYYASDTYNSGLSDGGGTDSIYATDQVVAKSFVAFSDERIKNIQGRSDSAVDLTTLRGIEITDYHYKDTIAKGDRPQKKVIAQQVEKVFPQAVSQGTDVVPDIYHLAPIKDGWVSLATDLKVGERVKLITDQEENIHEVLEVREGAFRTAYQPAAEKIFVFGREVQDFRRVDYEAIAMLNVSATQELAKQLAAREAAIAVLEAKLAIFGEKLAAFEAAQESRSAARREAASPAPVRTSEAAVGVK